MPQEREGMIKMPGQQYNNKGKSDRNPQDKRPKLEIVVFNQKDEVELVEECAKNFANALKRDENMRTQLRKFYQEYVDIRQHIKYSNNKEKDLVRIKMLIAKVAYATGRKNSNALLDFLEWLKANLSAIGKDRNQLEEDVEKFGNYFEAFIGYFYAASAE